MFERWTPDEDKILKDMYLKGNTFKEISDVTGRSKGSIKTRLVILDLQRKRNCNVKKWTEKEEQFVIEQYNKGTKSNDIAKMLHREVGSVRGKIANLGLSKGVPKCKDLSGQRFGYLTVIKRVEDYVSPSGDSKMTQWLCKCDCGNYTIVKQSSLRTGGTKSCGCMKGILNGEKHRVINKYINHGDYTEGIDSNNRTFIFDTEDYDIVKDYCWLVDAKDGYVTSTDKNNGYKNTKLHVLVMNAHYDIPKGMKVDHIKTERKDDNRKSNLRIVTNKENTWNHKLYSLNTSGYTGVSWCKNSQNWVAYITANGKRIWLGHYKDKEDAIAARKDAEEKYFGEFSYDNSQKIAEANKSKSEDKVAV